MPQHTKYWLTDGDHPVAPRKRAGFTKAQHIRTAIGQTVVFVTARC